MTRRPVSISIGQLVDVEAHPTDAFFREWRCRLCRHRAGAVDHETALTEAAHHLASAHRAQGGFHRNHRRRNR